jgi:hypothetical protein
MSGLRSIGSSSTRSSHFRKEHGNVGSEKYILEYLLENIFRSGGREFVDILSLTALGESKTSFRNDDRTRCGNPVTSSINTVIAGQLYGLECFICNGWANDLTNPTDETIIWKSSMSLLRRVQVARKPTPTPTRAPPTPTARTHTPRKLLQVPWSLSALVPSHRTLFDGTKIHNPSLRVDKRSRVTMFFFSRFS